MADPDNAPRYEDRLIRSLIRLKKFDAAARAAKGSTDRDGDPLFEAVVAIASGHVGRAGPLLERSPRSVTVPTSSTPTLTPARFSRARRSANSGKSSLPLSELVEKTAM